MKTTFMIFLAVIILQFSNSCGSKKIESSKDTAIDMHVANNSLDWQGVYTGILPCTDCNGIQTVLILFKDMTYSMKKIHIGKSDPNYPSNGKFSWCKNGTTIEIKDSLNISYFLVAENALVKTSSCMNIFSENTNDSFVLKKDLLGLIEKTWVLFELNGKTNFASSIETQLRFYAYYNSFYSNGSCNKIIGNYFMNENTLQFNNISSTRMMCMGGGVDESEFIEALKKIDSYFIKNDTLQLFRARMAPLAKFVSK